MKVGFVIILLVSLGLVVFITGWPTWIAFQNSEYALYYREDQFLDLRIGDSEDFVVGVLGEPLRRDWIEGLLYYRYSLPKEDTHYYKRDVIFEEGDLKQKVNELYLD